MWKEFTKIAAREGKPLSEIIKGLTTKYVQDHKEGNSTFKLEKWVKDPQFLAMPSLGDNLTHEYLDPLSDEDLQLLCKKVEARSKELSAAFDRRGTSLHDVKGPELKKMSEEDLRKKLESMGYSDEEQSRGCI